jgi:hypothetical protein
MPFQKGHAPFNKKKVATSQDVAQEPVSEETNVLAPQQGESVVPKEPERPEQKVKTTKEFAASIQPQVLDDPDFSHIYGWNMAELELTDVMLNKTAKVPKCVQEYCDARGLDYRWLSYPTVKQRGMRNYVALSLTPELRKKIKAGDCPPTVDIDVSNKLTWREDAFLGVIPKRFVEARRKAVQQRIIEQTRLARAAGERLREGARMAGGKIVEYSVEETSRQGL